MNDSRPGASRIEEPCLYTVNEAADFLRVSSGACRQMIQRGQLAAVRIGRRVRIRREDLLSLVQSAA